jgi:uncharacterized protein (UPF0276 family)
MASNLDSIPRLGSGLGWRREIADDIKVAAREIDFVEIIPEKYIGVRRGRNIVRNIAASFQAIPHGVSLSIASANLPDRSYLDELKAICEITKTPYYSEHLCVTRSPGRDLGHLSPAWYTDEVLDNVIRNVNAMQDFLERPLILENITLPFVFTQASWTQARFFRTVLEETDCGMLMDLTNLFTNSCNHGFSAIDSLCQFPLERVVQVHLAGGFRSHGELVDSHSEAVPEPVWELLAALAAKTTIRGSIVERDQNYPSFDVLKAEVRRAREILDSYGEHAHRLMAAAGDAA